jgi:mannonate dehydratase
MQESWRWFGPDDVAPLAAIRAAGASGVVTSLHQIPYGVAWSEAAIRERIALIEADPSLGLSWNVVESLPIHESVKLGEGDLSGVLDNYRQSMTNLAACGIRTICYNFMPVIDWTRTDLGWRLPGGARALRFDAAAFAAFDCFMLRRPGAEADHHPDALRRGKAWHDNASESARDDLLAAIMAGLPGAFDRYDIPGLHRMLDRYRDITAEGLHAHLAAFLREVIPLAEELGIRFAIHPDDPPRPLFGLPRIVSTEEDIAAVLAACPSVANGLTLCSGSLGAGPANDPVGIAARFAGSIHFAHLRNVAKEADGSFTEADHLDGDTDMVALVSVLLDEQERRRNAGDSAWRIPFRPDHGHELLDDVGKGSFPGYSVIGRLKGLAELRGVIRAVSALRSPVADHR